MAELASLPPEAGPSLGRILVLRRPEFLAFVERRVGSRALAEDIVQDAFARGLERAGQLRSEGAAIAWFYRVLRNTIIDSQRRRAAAGRSLAALAAEQPPPEPAEVANKVCSCVRALAGALKPEYADALHRIEIDGLAVKDYAAQVGITSNNASARLLRAREALRKQVARCCGSCADRGCIDCTCAHAPSG